MTTPSDILRWKTEPKVLEFYCPGCKTLHQIDLSVLPNYTRQPNAGWNNSFVSPSFTQNFQVFKDTLVCAYSMRNGALTFGSESVHELAGQTTEMVPIPTV